MNRTTLIIVRAAALQSMGPALRVAWYTAFAILLLPGLIATAGPPERSWLPKAPPLPQLAGKIVEVSSVDQLFEATENAKPGETILLADGHYLLPGVLALAADNVTLRSRSGDRHAVVLDGKDSRHGELVLIRGEGATVADLTIQNVKHNGFKIASELGAQRTRIYNCVIHNIWQRGVKASHIPPDRPHLYPRDCRVQFCLFYNDRPKRFSDDETDTPETFDGNYVGGIDVKNTLGWTISDNVFVGIQGRTREGRACIYISEEGRDCLIERNICIDCDVGIALGNPSRGGDWLHALDCVVRNNFITRCPETGILACYTGNCQILHNTVHEPESRHGRLIWVQNVNDELRVTNNLLSGAPVLVTSDSRFVLQDNVVRDDLAELFADASAGNLRLTEPARGITDACQRLPLVSHDIDHQPRLDLPDAGADEFTCQAAVARHDAGPDVASIPQASEEPSWVEAMRKVHAGFDGQAGYVAQFGDSITYSMAFWTPIDWDEPQRYLRTEDGLPKMPPGRRWRDVVQGERDKGPKYGNDSGWTLKDVLQAVPAVLKRERPEVAIVMVGTNDISGGRVPESYRADLESVVRKCLEAGCVPILNTIPPRRGHEQVVEQLNEIVRAVAQELHVPLVDYHAEVLRLRPDGTWQGTLISGDGVHPTAGETNVYTEENLRNCGYALRNWLNFLMLRNVYFRVLHPTPAADANEAGQPANGERQP